MTINLGENGCPRCLEKWPLSGQVPAQCPSCGYPIAGGLTSPQVTGGISNTAALAEPPAPANAPASAGHAAVLWYMRNPNGGVFGPADWPTILRWQRESRIGPGAMFRKEGESIWQSAERIRLQHAQAASSPSQTLAHEQPPASAKASAELPVVIQSALAGPAEQAAPRQQVNQPAALGIPTAVLPRPNANSLLYAQKRLFPLVHYMMAVCLLTFMIHVASAAYLVYVVVNNEDPLDWLPRNIFFLPFQYSHLIIEMSLNCFVMYGLFSIYKWRSLNLALLSLTMAIVPTSCCSTLLSPLALWGLVVLCDPQIIRAFKK